MLAVVGRRKDGKTPEGSHIALPVVNGNYDSHLPYHKSLVDVGIDDSDIPGNPHRGRAVTLEGQQCRKAIETILMPPHIEQYQLLRDGLVIANNVAGLPSEADNFEKRVLQYDSVHFQL